MGSFKAQDIAFEKKVRESFDRQSFMDFIHAEISDIKPGFCEIQLPYKAELSQQHGYFHAGVIGTIADNCGGYAAFSLMPAGASVLTTEYKLNLVAPGDGERLIGRANVLKAGRTLSICETKVFAVKNGVEKLCAVSLMTVMTMHGKPDTAISSVDT